MISLQKIQHKEKRIKNFAEVLQGLSKKTAVEEARRFPQFSNPAHNPISPLGFDIPGFVRLLREGKINSALTKIKEFNVMPGICSRVCPPFKRSETVEKEGSVVLDIDIRALERFVADNGKELARAHKSKRCTGEKVAIVGSGPAGLAAAASLAKNNYQVTIFESFPLPGGVLRYAIPGFRLPKSVLDHEIEEIKSLGVEIKTGCVVGQLLTVDEIFAQEYKAVLFAVGMGGSRLSALPGAHFNGVYYGNDLLLQVNSLDPAQFKAKASLKLGSKVTILGLSNLALDCARVCVRLGCEVSLIFPGTEEEIGAEQKELQFAKEESINIMALTEAFELISNEQEKVRGVKCRQLDYADPNSDGNWQIIPVPDSEIEVETDTVIIAFGHYSNTSVRKILPQLKLTGIGSLEINETTGMTSVKGVFACGSVVHGLQNIDETMASGIKSAEQIDQYLKGSTYE